MVPTRERAGGKPDAGQHRPAQREAIGHLLPIGAGGDDGNRAGAVTGGG